MTQRVRCFVLLLLVPISSAFFGDKRKSLSPSWGRWSLTRRDDVFPLVPRGGEEVNDAILDSPTVSSDTVDPSSTTEDSFVREMDKSVTIDEEVTIPTSTDQSSTSNVTTSTDQPLPAWKAALPPLLQRKGSKTLQRLVLGDVEIYLLGTAHVSNDSCHDVRLLLESVSPSCIFVELCDARIPLLDGTDNAPGTEGDLKNTNTETEKLSWTQRIANIQESQGGSKFQALATLLLTSVQEDYADTLGVELGGEFRAAHEYWKSQRRTQMQQYPPNNAFPVLILGDRPLSLTLVRAWESLTWWPKLKVMGGLLWSSFSKPNPEEIRSWLESVLREESDVLTESLAELRHHFPSLHTTIIAERDAWLACKLVQTCRILRGAVRPRRSKLVAIVGAGHVPGIVQMLTASNPGQTTEAILHDLCQTQRWQTDELMQKQIIPQWVNDVTQVQDPDFTK
eukprot:scaffold630_cov174-Amphora_coffeaeformis.AAC.4